MKKSDYDIVEICRLAGRDWRQVANPTDAELKQAAFWLSNLFNEYVEYSNEGGAVTRYIRRKDLPKYLTEAQPPDAASVKARWSK